VSALRLSVAENRLSDPSKVTRAMYEEYVTTRGRGWVAEDGGGILGFSIGDRSGSVWALFVRPGCEGSGVGQALMRACLEWMAGLGLEEAELETGAGTRAERFYRRFGWHETARAENDVTFRIRLR
jgi:GNAT superfamily N-acetyltransferase